MNGRTLRAEGVTANLAASGAVQIEAARLDDLAVGPLRLEAKRSGDTLEIEAQARGEGWALTRLTGSAPDVFRTLALPRSAAASWALNARIPPALGERLAALGLDVSPNSKPSWPRATLRFRPRASSPAGFRQRSMPRARWCSG